MGKVNLPLSSFRWTEGTKPSGPQHIVYEEFDAALWGIEGRMARPTEVGTRSLQGGDSSAVVASRAKGRSSTRAMNRRCRKVTAVSLAFDLYLFALLHEVGAEPGGQALSYSSASVLGRCAAGLRGGSPLRGPAPSRRCARLVGLLGSGVGLGCHCPLDRSHHQPERRSALVGSFQLSAWALLARLG